LRTTAGRSCSGASRSRRPGSSRPWPAARAIFFAIRNRSRADAAVRDALFTRALELDARFHDRVGAGELMSRASNDAELIARMLDSIGHTVGYLVTVAGVSVALLLIDLHLALAVLVPLPLLTFGFWRYSTRYAQRTKGPPGGTRGLNDARRGDGRGHPHRQGPSAPAQRSRRASGSRATAS